MNNTTELFYYDSQTQVVVKTLSPTIEINYQVPASFTKQLLMYMGKGLVKVYDKDGNRLEVCYDAR